MALINKTLLVSRISINIAANGFKTSVPTPIDQKYRKERGLTENPNAHGPLTNWPDYSFKDGRVTPLGIRLRTRLNKQQKYATKIIQLTKEIDYAVRRQAELEARKEQEERAILDRKLKPKGDALLRSES